MSHGGLRSIVRRLLDRRGFTLMEVLVGITILVTVTSTMSLATFQILNIQRSWRAEVVATRDLRSAIAAFSTDTISASTTTLVSLANAVTSTSLQWTNVSNVTSTPAYSVTGTGANKTLVRTVGGQPREIARNVNSVQISRSGDLVTFFIEINVTGGDTVSTTLLSTLRNLND